MDENENPINNMLIKLSSLERSLGFADIFIGAGATVCERFYFDKTDNLHTFIYALTIFVGCVLVRNSRINYSATNDSPTIYFENSKDLSRYRE